ncbi:MAG: LuxR C-terminal-related transcriptional regulator [Candidatus Eremiobacteraeota bacterium]|nr:LuxR C-terminal-related transcriptional regulator [Candidatus Eremiobacteraeota bacterium]
MKAALSVRDAHRLAALGRIDHLKRALHDAGGKRAPARMIIDAVIAQYGADVARCVSGLKKALANVSQTERAYVADLLVPVLLMQNETVDAIDILNSITTIPDELRPLFGPLRAIADVLSGKDVFDALVPANDYTEEIFRARSLQRIATAAYYASEWEIALESSQGASRITERLGSYRSSAATLSIAYNVHYAITGDVERAYSISRQMVALAEKAKDRSFRMPGLIAQYELAADFGDLATVERIRASINRSALPTQYNERGPRGLADTLPHAWASDFNALRANATMLNKISTVSKAVKALAMALRGLAEAGLGDVVASRRSSRNAIALASIRSKVEPAFDARYRRVARAVAGATCILIGDAVRGRRAVDIKALREDADVLDIIAAAEGEDWRRCSRRVRGYARAVSATRIATTRAKGVLTEVETAVLVLLADGASAPQIARDTDRSVHTIRAHTRNIIAKLQVHGRGAAISEARRIGLIR